LSFFEIFLFSFKFFFSDRRIAAWLLNHVSFEISLWFFLSLWDVGELFCGGSFWEHVGQESGFIFVEVSSSLSFVFLGVCVEMLP
jgi:hypothetical protein